MDGVSLGALFLELGLDTTTFYDDLEKTRQNLINNVRDIKLNLDVKVNHKPLYELNKHLDLKKKHAQDVQRYFDSNPLTVKVNSSGIDESIRKLERLKSLSRNPIKVNIEQSSKNSDLKELDKLPDKIGKAVSKATKSGGIGNIFSSILQIPANLTKTVGLGLIQGLTQEVSRGMGKGVATALENSIGKDFGSTELLGTKLGEKFIESFTAGIGDKFNFITTALESQIEKIDDRKLKQKLLNIVSDVKTLPSDLKVATQTTLGTTNIQKESLYQRSQTRKSEQRKQPAIREQAAVEWRDSLNQFDQISQKSDQFVNRFEHTIAEKVIEYKTLATAYKKLDEELNFLQSQNIKGEALEITASELRQVSDSMQSVMSEIKGLQDSIVKLKKVKNESETNLRTKKQAYDQIQPKQQPLAYENLAKNVLGNNFNTEKLPDLVVDDAYLKQQNAGSVYQTARNRIVVTQEMAKAIQNNTLTFEQAKILGEELAHAEDFDFGSAKGLQAAKKKQPLGRKVTPTAEELKTFTPELGRYAERDRPAELNAKVKGLRGAQAYQADKANIDRINQLSDIAVAGDKAGIKKDLFIGYIKILKDLAKANNRNVDQLVDNYVDSYKSVLSQIKAISEKATNNPMMGSDEIQELSADLELAQKQFNQIFVDIKANAQKVVDGVLTDLEIQQQNEAKNALSFLKKRDVKKLATEYGIDTKKQNKNQLIEALVNQPDILGVKNKALTISRNDAQKRLDREERIQDVARFAGGVAKGTQNVAKFAGSKLQQLTGSETSQKLLASANDTSKSLVLATKNTYKMAQAMESVALAVIPFAKPLKWGLKNVALPMAAYGAATHFLPGGAMAGEMLTHATTSAVSPLTHMLGSGATEALTTNVTSHLPQMLGIQSAVTTATTGAIEAATSAATSGIGQAATSLIAGKALTNIAGKTVQAPLRMIDKAEPLALPQGKNKALPQGKQKALPQVEQLALPGEVATVKAPKNVASEMGEAAKQAVDKVDGILKSFSEAYKVLKEMVKNGDLDMAENQLDMIKKLAAKARMDMNFERMGEGTEKLKAGNFGAKIASRMGNLTRVENNAEKQVAKLRKMKQSEIPQDAIDVDVWGREYESQNLQGFARTAKKVKDQIYNSIDEELANLAKEFDSVFGQSSPETEELRDLTAFNNAVERQLKTASEIIDNVYETEMKRRNQELLAIGARVQEKVNNFDPDLLVARAINDDVTQESQATAVQNQQQLKGNRRMLDNLEKQGFEGSEDLLKVENEIKPILGKSLISKIKALFTGINQDLDKAVTEKTKALLTESHTLLNDIRTSAIVAKNEGDTDQYKKLTKQGDSLEKNINQGQEIVASDNINPQQIESLKTINAEIRKTYDLFDKSPTSDPLGFDSMLTSGGKLLGMLKGLGLGFIAFKAFEMAKTQLIGFAKESLNAALQLDKLKIGLDNITKSRKDTNAGLDFSKNIATDLNTPLQAVQQGFVKLSAAARNTKVEGQGVKDLLLGVSQASAVMGMSADDTNGIILALSQTLSKGKVQAEELRGQIGERLPGAFQIAADAMGVSTMELNKMMELGQVTSENFIPKFAKQLQKEFGGSAKDAANSVQGAMNQLDNSILTAQQSFGQMMQPAQMAGLKAASVVIDLVAKNFHLLAGAIEFAAIVLATKFIPPLVGMAINALKALPALLMGSGKAALFFGGAVKLAMSAFIIPAAIFAGLAVLKETLNYIIPDDNTKQMNKFTDNIIDGLEKVKLKASEARGELNNILPNKTQVDEIVGEGLGDKVVSMSRNLLKPSLGAIEKDEDLKEFYKTTNPVKVEGGKYVGTITSKESQYNRQLDSARLQTDLMQELMQEQLNKGILTTGKGEFNIGNAIGNVGRLDQDILDLQGRKKFASSQPVKDEKLIASIDQVINEKMAEREKQIAPINEIRNVLKGQLTNVDQQIEANKETYKNAPEALKRMNSELGLQKNSIEQNLRIIEAFEKPLKNSLDPVLALSMGFEKMNRELSEIERKTNKTFNLEQLKNAQAELDGFGKNANNKTESAISRANAELERSRVMATETKRILDETTKTLDNPVNQKALQGVTTSSGKQIDRNSTKADLENAKSRLKDGDPKKDLIDQISTYQEAVNKLDVLNTDYAKNQLLLKEALQQDALNKIDNLKAEQDLINRKVENANRLKDAQDRANAAMSKAKVSLALASNQMGTEDAAIKNAEIAQQEAQAAMASAERETKLAQLKLDGLKNQKAMLDKAKTEGRISQEEYVRRNREMEGALNDAQTNVAEMATKKIEAQARAYEALAQKIEAARQKTKALNDANANLDKSNINLKVAQGQMSQEEGAIESAKVDIDKAKKDLAMAKPGAEKINAQATLNNAKAGLLNAEKSNAEKEKQKAEEKAQKKMQRMESKMNLEKAELSKRVAKGEMTDTYAGMLSDELDIKKAKFGVKNAKDETERNNAKASLIEAEAKQMNNLRKIEEDLTVKILEGTKNIISLGQERLSLSRSLIDSEMAVGKAIQEANRSALQNRITLLEKAFDIAKQLEDQQLAIKDTDSKSEKEYKQKKQADQQRDIDTTTKSSLQTVLQNIGKFAGIESTSSKDILTVKQNLEDQLALKNYEIMLSELDNSRYMLEADHLNNEMMAESLKIEAEILKVQSQMLKLAALKQGENIDKKVNTAYVNMVKARASGNAEAIKSTEKKYNLAMSESLILNKILNQATMSEEFANAKAAYADEFKGKQEEIYQNRSKALDVERNSKISTAQSENFIREQDQTLALGKAGISTSSNNYQNLVAPINNTADLLRPLVDIKTNTLTKASEFNVPSTTPSSSTGDLNGMTISFDDSRIVKSIDNLANNIVNLANNRSRPNLTVNTEEGAKAAGKIWNDITNLQADTDRL